MTGFGNNISALRAQRALNEQSLSLARVFTRLSTGQRINTAADDAAGLAISDSLNARARLMGTAMRGINDGISYLNIAEGGINQQVSILQRLSELAEQSANGVYGDTQREALEEEYRSLILEFHRIAASTEFNGRKPLSSRKGGDRELVLQAGIDGGVNSQLRLSGAETGALSGTISAGDFRFPSLNELLTFITANFGGTISYSRQELETLFNGLVFYTEGTDSQGRTQEVAIVLAGPISGGGGAAFLGFSRSLSDPTKWENEIDLTDLSQMLSGKRIGSSGYFLSNNLTPEDIGLTNLVSLSSPLDLRGLRLSGSLDGTAAVNPGLSSSAIDFTNILSAFSSRRALDVIAARRAELSSTLSEFGAFSSRLNTALNVLGATREQTTASESRIRDADIGFETSRLVAGQILQQSAASVLRQTTSQYQLYLGLLLNA